MKRFYLLFAIITLGLSMVAYGNYIDDDMSDWTGGMLTNWVNLGGVATNYSGGAIAVTIEQVEGVYGGSAARIIATNDPDAVTTYRYTMHRKGYFSASGQTINIKVWLKQPDAVLNRIAWTYNNGATPNDPARNDAQGWQIWAPGTIAGGGWSNIEDWTEITGTNQSWTYASGSVVHHAYTSGGSNYIDRVIVGSPASITDWDLY